MKKQQVDHALRAAGRSTGEKQFIIIGSQSLHGKYPDIADEILTSFEVDLVASKNADRTEWLNVIGVDSPFHESFGYYADPVDLNTATLPQGWKGRLVNLLPGETDGVRGLCLEPHDLAIAKYAAAREQVTRDFHAERGLEERAAGKQPPAAHTVDDPEAVKARGRAEWLKLRRQAGVKSPVSNPTRTRDSSKRSELERDSGKGLDDDASE